MAARTSTRMRQIGATLVATGLLSGAFGLAAGPAQAVGETQDILYQFIFEGDPTVYEGRSTTNSVVITVAST